MNPEGKIPTPNIDRIAKEGMRFTDAHAASAICTPSRYAALTGRYCWRTLRKGIVGPYGDTILPPSRMTVADLLKGKGYATGCFGKWHLGMGWDKIRQEQDRLPEVDFTTPLTAGPMSNGFDEYFGVDVPNWPPYCYIDGNRTIGLPSGEIPLGISNEEVSIKGPYVKGWKLEDVLPAITDRACAFIERKASNPFFIYFPLTSPHTPLAVNEPWKGRSGLGVYADFVMETDAMVGRVLETLDRKGTAGNTLIMFASDNGCAPCGIQSMESQGHFPSYIFRGFKSHAWDGGHRIPLVARWPGVVEPGSVYQHLVCLSDIFATVAQITGVAYPDAAGEDSVSFLSALESNPMPVREYIVSHSAGGKFAIRKGVWKLILCAGSGGFWKTGTECHPSDAEAREMGLPPYQLYNMESDIGEINNLYYEQPGIVKDLVGVLRRYADNGRSTPGEPQKNDIDVCLDPEESAVLLDDY